jgi:hypothetical protein
MNYTALIFNHYKNILGSHCPDIVGTVVDGDTALPCGASEFDGHKIPYKDSFRFAFKRDPFMCSAKWFYCFATAALVLASVLKVRNFSFSIIANFA